MSSASVSDLSMLKAKFFTFGNMVLKIFMKALDGWSRISDNIFVWDYGINFDNMVAPFPNFHIVQPNMQIFRDHHVTMHFSQIASTLGTDFSEMRSYLAAKLM